MLSKVLSSSFLGVETFLVDVEVDINNGLPAFNIVGMGDTAIAESKERVRAGIKNSSFEITPKKIVVNLSPADVRKEGAAFDLPIAVGILSCYGVLIKEKLKDYLIIGELSLSGEIKSTKGIINAVILAKEKGLKGVILPYENRNEACLIKDIDIILVKNLKDVASFLNDGIQLEYSKNEVNQIENEKYSIDFSEVKGQHQAKRAMEISAAGGHNLFMIGPPGSGKSMLAKRFVTILPEMNEQEKIESTKIYSVAGMLNKEKPVMIKRPFRSPHHTASDVSLIGGGRIAKPGEISLAHNGVLFLDEMAEFPKKVLETLRQPLEDRTISISRSLYRTSFPSNFILIGASNPCPCGHYGNEGINFCTCTERERKKYMEKLSGPILDRIDLYVEVQKLKENELFNYTEGEKSESIKNRIESARIIQNERFKNKYTNSNMTSKDIKKYCLLNEEAENILKMAGRNMNLSARGFDRILKVSRTIADLAGAENIEVGHLLEALNFRRKMD